MLTVLSAMAQQECENISSHVQLFKDIEIMPKFDKDVFECFIDKVIIEKTPVILGFVRKEDISKNKRKNKNEDKKSKFNNILVKFMFNLECGNIKNN